MAYKFNQTFSVHTEYDWEGQHYSFDTPIPFQFSVEVKDFKPMVSYCFKRYFDGACIDEESLSPMNKLQLEQLQEYITSLDEDNIILPLALYSISSDDYTGLVIATDSIKAQFSECSKICDISLSELFECKEEDNVSVDGLYNRCYLCGKLIKTGTNNGTNIYFRDTGTKFHMGCMKKLENEWRQFK